MDKTKIYAAVFIMTTFLTCDIAFAAEGVVDPTNSLASVRLNAMIVQALVSIFIPLLVGLVTKIGDHALLKGGLDLVLNAVSDLIVQGLVADGSLVLSKQTVIVWLTGTATSLVLYAKAWKPAGLTSSAVQVPSATPGQTISIPGKLSEVGLRKD